MLDRLPSTGASDVQRAIGELQEIAPAVPAGAGTEPIGVRSADWNDAQAALSASCDELAAPLAIGMFTGG